MKLVKVGRYNFIDIEKITKIRVLRDEVVVWVDGNRIATYYKDAINIINHVNGLDKFDEFSEFLIKNKINLESDNE